ncbi:DNA polymerase III subunit gamma/tau [Moraxella bovis]|uniref:DNA polymerase III subunit gamma/tau n=1 Tax=Moraxella bovis TaxID=476 RepID=UPI0022278841|nr:DNA polymerase III subunit gamma/tau [Moraxella bovis]UZA28429.1 DNA polymerase III subunit gamma/tau [Moraxella bovis]
MSEYQVLARKYRPKNFSELLGQTHVSQALSHAIDTGRLHHAYLFTGTRGVGKTTIARILAKCLNCETGITSTPCGVCDTCVSVDNGRFIDLIEIDAASRTKVEDTRDLLENVPYAPTQGRYKVYLIDEVHMLSTHSFNALLKTLEEPPQHVKFILATTDPQKLPITIVSRCLQFVLRPMSQELLHAHLAKILHAENIAHDDTALWQLAQSAKGSVRDALSLTDQAIAFGGGQVGADTVMEMLGLVDSLDVLDLVRDIYHDDRSGVARHIARMREQMVDATALLDRLVDSFHAMALVQILPDMPLDMNDEQKQAFYHLAHTLPADVIQLYYEISVKARDSVRLASTPMQALEMGILRLLAFRPLAGDEVIYQEPKAILNQQTDNCVNQSLNDESLNDESLNDESLNDESLNDESLNDESLNDESLNDESLNDESLNDESLNDESLNDESLNDESLNDESLNDESLNDESLNDESLNDESLNDESLNDESLNDESLNDESLNDESLNDESLNDESLAISQNTEIIENHYQEIGNQEIGNQEIGNQEIGNQEIGNQEIGNQEIGNQEIGNQEIGNQEIGNQEIGNQEIGNQEIGNQEIGNQEIGNQEIGNQEIGNQEIGNQEIGNQEIGNQEIGNQEIGNQEIGKAVNNSQSINDIKPSGQITKEQLNNELMPQQVALAGEWTPEKWDYWVAVARREHKLDADELAMVSHAMMAGQIDGDCQLYVPEHNKQIFSSFKSFAKKFGQDFANGRLRDEMPLLSQSEFAHLATPVQKQKQRDEQVLAIASNQLLNSPVLQSLYRGNFINDDNAITSVRLTLNE